MVVRVQQGALGLEKVDGVSNGDYNYTQHFAPIGEPGTEVAYYGHPFDAGLGRLGDVVIGDDTAGPMFAITSWAEGVGGPFALHHHRAATFRICVGPSREQLIDGRIKMGHGDFMVMPANYPYDQIVSPKGSAIFNMEADRRGSPSLVHGADQEALVVGFEESLKDGTKYGYKFPDFRAFHTDEEADEAGAGVVSSSLQGDKVSGGKRIVGSFHDDSQWDVLADGSKAAIFHLGNPEWGPVVICLNTVAGVVESPRARYAGDRIRLLVGGSLEIGDREYFERQYRSTEAGTFEGPVVHGPKGSSEVIILADRRTWLPVEQEAGDATDQAQPRLREIAELIDKYAPDLQPA